jgi:polyisoprenoid-binding protein YceI
MEVKMKPIQFPTIRPLLLALFGTALSISALAANTNYKTATSPAATAEFSFSVTFIPIPGRINAVSAALNFDPKNLGKTTGTVSVNLSKLDTGIGLRDEHARGYLGAEKHPNAVFTLSSIGGIKTLEKGKEATGIVIGKFDLNGISKPLSAPITLKFDGTRVNVSTAFKVTLSDHNISIPGADPTVAVKVNFTLEPKL